MTKTILAIVPCYNEATSLPSLLGSLKQLRIPGYQLSIAVINDASADATASVAKAAGVTVLDLPVNLGIGGAMQTGFRYAQQQGFDFALQVDGDGQHPPSEIPKLLARQEETNANLVIGSRFLLHEGFQSSFMRRLGIQYFHWLNRIFTGNAIYDATSGFRLLDKKAIDKAAMVYPDEYPEPESLVLFARSGFKIAETAVVMQARTGGTSSISSAGSIYYLIKVTIAMFFSFIRHY
ncbi:glycosyltransferase family 2 protein [Filimonas effusa]|uniref:Glycosyltransferase family 2 protein n=1 Tax=Filimonas effusa TaxID=2508721 RepID=A0A4V1MAB6_9BACT|nr:glycosyltransferase family 2 protein [Filimonas effusa]RXK85306.1 glycosyltransferase family 2 protein [Filimonas effusa]